jgi:hypothetical protein
MAEKGTGNPLSDPVAKKPNNVNSATVIDEVIDEVFNHVIDPEGDLTLIIFPEPWESKQKVHRFLVSAHVLALFSPVFKVSLSDKVLEATSTEISLYGDDPDGLQIVLWIAHHQRNLLPSEIRLKTLFSLSVLADNYEIADIIGPIAAEYSKPYSPLNFDVMKSHELFSWLSFSKTFGYRDIFYTCFNQLVKHLYRIEATEGTCRCYAYNGQPVENEQYIPNKLLRKCFQHSVGLIA